VAGAAAGDQACRPFARGATQAAAIGGDWAGAVSLVAGDQVAVAVTGGCPGQLPVVFDGGCIGLPLPFMVNHKVGWGPGRSRLKPRQGHLWALAPVVFQLLRELVQAVQNPQRNTEKLRQAGAGRPDQSGSINRRNVLGAEGRHHNPAAAAGAAPWGLQLEYDEDEWCRTRVICSTTWLAP
jgi:hypothetical protein